jgi:dihydroorotate dehydrogenase
MFCFEPETAHFIAMRLLDILSKYGISRFLMQQLIIGKIKNNNPVHVAGLTFPNAVGLAAGFDKNAEHIDALALLGFGFIEIGTVTPLPQPGNPKPRLFRLVKDSAIINRMGFNNEGAEAVLNNLKRRRNKKILIGGNLGKNKGTPNEEAVQDYIKCFDLLYNEVDYFVVNVSSPNTPGLRALQDKKPLMDILSVLMQRNRSKGHPKPLFLKIAPDLNESQLIDIVEIARTTEIQGIIATNTTISREHLHTSQQTLEQIGAGGLSGLPLKERSTNVIQFLRSRLPKPFVIIGVGGIHSVKDALEKKQAGADLVQIYTGLIYEGPSLIAQIANRF